jgi:hypothetical protein
MPAQLIGDGSKSEPESNPESDPESDSESDPAACLQACFAAIKGGRNMLGLMAIRSARRILENQRGAGFSIRLTQLHASNSRQFGVERKETCDVLLELMTQPASSPSAIQQEAALLLGELTDFHENTDEFCKFARVSFNSPHETLVELCLGAMSRMMTDTRNCGPSLIALGETEQQKALVDRLCVSIVKAASPSASALLVTMANCVPALTSPYTPTLRRCLEQLATHVGNWAPNHLWFMAAVLTGVSELENIGVACIPLAAVLPQLEKEQEYAQPALYVLSRVAVIGNSLPAEVIARAPQLLMHDNPTTRYAALRILGHTHASCDSTFFVERILPGIHDFILDIEPAPLEVDALLRETRCPAVLAHTMHSHSFDRRCFFLEAIMCVGQACAAPPEQAAVSLPALLKSPTFSALLTVACSTANLAYLARQTIAQAIESKFAGYEAVARAAGPDNWQRLIDHVSSAEAVAPCVMILVTSIIVKESVEVALRVLPVVAGTLRNHGSLLADASLEFATTILRCCAVADADETYLAAGWESLGVILGTATRGAGDPVAVIVHDHLPLFLSALRHEKPAVRRAAVQFAGSLGERATFPPPAHAAMVDAMTETLKAISAKERAAALLRGAEAETRRRIPRGNATCNGTAWNTRDHASTMTSAAPLSLQHQPSASTNAGGWRAAPQSAWPNNGSVATVTRHPPPNEDSCIDPFIAAARNRLGDYSPEQRPMYITAIEEAARKYNIGSTALRPSFDTPTDEVSDILVVLRDWGKLYPMPDRVGTNGPAYEIAHIAIAYMKSPSDHTALALDILTCMHEQGGAAFVSSLEDDVYLAVAALAALRGHKDPAIKKTVAGHGSRRAA